jgi:hypothetical protein
VESKTRSKPGNFVSQRIYDFEHDPVAAKQQQASSNQPLASGRAQLETPLSGSEVLRIFRGDGARLFVAAASITVGLAAIGFSLIRRRFDRLLSFFAWFAAQRITRGAD